MNAYRFYRYLLPFAALLIFLATMSGDLRSANASAVTSQVQQELSNKIFLPCINKPCQPIIIDDFSAPSPYWQDFDILPIFSVGYGTGNYVINISTPHNPQYDTYFTTGNYLNYQGSDYKMTISGRVSLAPTEGFYPQYGIIFDRYDDVGQSITKYYAFEIVTNGDWYVWFYDSTQIDPWGFKGSGHSAEYINPGTALNRLGVEKSGSIINVYANGHKLNVDPISDTNDVVNGYVGVIAENSLSDTSVSYYFDDFGLYPSGCDWAEIQSTNFTPTRISHLTEIPALNPSFGRIDARDKSVNRQQ